MSGYQLMIRGELFRGRFRKGFDNPLPFKPEEITPVNYTLYDVAHTFLPGHRLMIQIQSSWFPIIDRNPQRFIDTYHCTVEDFGNITVDVDAEGAAKLYRENDTAEVVNFSYDAGGFHGTGSSLIKLGGLLAVYNIF